MVQPCPAFRGSLATEVRRLFTYPEARTSLFCHALWALAQAFLTQILIQLTLLLFWEPRHVRTEYH